MKTTATQSLLFAGLGMAMGILASSCVIRETQPTTVTTLPHGYRTEVIGGTTYYVYDRTYYRPRSGGYVVVDAPAHAETVAVTQLPSGYRTIRHGGRVYYQSNNVYYERMGDRYVVVTSPF